VTELTKTLELKLVEPNAHKRRKLRETREAYQNALQDAFDAGCTTPRKPERTMLWLTPT
jgi:hypothetical protein